MSNTPTSTWKERFDAELHYLNEDPSGTFSDVKAFFQKEIDLAVEGEQERIIALCEDMKLSDPDIFYARMKPVAALTALQEKIKK